MFENLFIDDFVCDIKFNLIFMEFEGVMSVLSGLKFCGSNNFCRFGNVNFFGERRF